MLESRLKCLWTARLSLQLLSTALGIFGLTPKYRGGSFSVYLPPKKSRADQFRAHLRLIQWRIVGLDLPGDLKQHLAQELVKDRLRPGGSQ
jgi:hypothetical protein